MRVRVLRFGLVLVCLTLSPTAHADASAADRALAQALFDEGRELLAAGRYAEACEKLQKSQILDPRGGTVLNLALCHEKQGLIATAWIEYHDALVVARRDGREDREAAVKRRISELAPLLSRLTIKVHDGMPAGIEILRNGTQLSEAAWNTAAPVDPGPQVVVARAPGYEPWSVTIVVGDQADAKTVDIPATLRPSADARPPVEQAPALRAVGAPAERGSSWSPQKTISVVTGGIGIVGVVVGSIFGARTYSEWSTAKMTCKGTSPPLQCDAPGKAAADAAGKSGLISTISFVAGGVALAGGVVLFVTAPKAKRDAPPASAMAIGPAIGGVVLKGVF